jgi:hypothetical protein
MCRDLNCCCVAGDILYGDVNNQAVQLFSVKLFLIIFVAFWLMTEVLE